MYKRQGLHIYLKNRIVAIKLLHRAYLGSQKERENFLQEAQLLEMLKHPNILPILDVGIEDGIPYFVAEYAPSGSLRDHLQAAHPHPLQLDVNLLISEFPIALADALDQVISRSVGMVSRTDGGTDLVEAQAG